MNRPPSPLPFVALLLLVPGLAVAGPGSSPPGEFGIPQIPVVVDGYPVEPCGWPTTLSIGGCTATLIHPRAIATAQHCGKVDEVEFMDAEGGKSQSVDVLGCVDTGSSDARICELAEEVTAVPPTPVLYGCEVDQYLKTNQDVIVAGFGREDPDKQSSGIKRWAPHEIASIHSEHLIVGEPGDPMSPCKGDSGGPVFVQVSDGSWRIIGTLRGGTTNKLCNSAADYKRLDQVVPHFEEQTGIDITPCFDGQTGAWEPGPDCGSFFAGDHSGAGSSGTWDNWCAGTPASALSDQCGEPWTDSDDSGDGDSGDDDSGDDDSGDSGDPSGDDGSMDDGSADDGSTDDGSTDDGSTESGGDGSGESDEESGETGSSSDTGFHGDFGGDLEEGGCSCRADTEPGRSGAALLWGILLLLGLSRRPRAVDRDSAG